MKADQIGDFSNFGEAIDIVAPRVNIPTTERGGGYGISGSGTSPAAAMVTGAIALLLAVDPALTIEQTEHYLYTTAL